MIDTSTEQAVSPVMAAFDRRQELVRCCPLYAVALHAVAIQEGRCGPDIADTAHLAAVAREGREALEQHGVDVEQLLDLTYPRR